MLILFCSYYVINYTFNHKFRRKKGRFILNRVLLPFSCCLPSEKHKWWGQVGRGHSSLHWDAFPNTSERVYFSLHGVSPTKRWTRKQLARFRCPPHFVCRCQGFARFPEIRHASKIKMKWVKLEEVSEKTVCWVLRKAITLVNILSSM